MNKVHCAYCYSDFVVQTLDADIWLCLDCPRFLTDAELCLPDPWEVAA